MATVKQHYEEVLADVYSWMYGGFENGLQRNREFIAKHRLTPKRSAIAVDLGAGSGFQSIPIAEAGYQVTAIDLSARLLDELKTNSKGLPINVVQGDLLEFDSIVNNKPELIVCMTDTIVHLDSKENVSALFSKVFNALEPCGKFVITFRDLTHELKDHDRFIPVRSDDNTVFTCFLEYEPETVKVHDIVYRKIDGKWNLSKSFFRKLRLSRDWVEGQLMQFGFKILVTDFENGFITIIGQK
ncbi:MAG: class I SAM-dependent methyltransferase [Deltaproteobacteria bacterium]|nr:class I SAM-dependent methyltransferase [Deltaproteobacteria bacterium]